MSAARDNLSEYSEQVAAYASCLDAEQADAGRAAGGDARHLRNEDLGRGSAALVQLASVVSCFSQQVQAFHATGGGSDAGAGAMLQRRGAAPPGQFPPGGAPVSLTRSAMDGRSASAGPRPLRKFKEL